MKRSLMAALLLGAGASLTAAPCFAEALPTAETAPITLAQGYGPEAKPYEQGKGFYATIGLGAQWPSDRGYHVNSSGPDLDGNVSYGGGFSGDIGLGYDFGAIRSELTYGYSNASVNSISRSGGGDGSVDGSINKNDVLVSAYWDIPTGSRWVPYVGGGIGWTNLGSSGLSTSAGSSGSGNINAFGWQAKVGVSYGASESTDIYLEGVYQGASGADVDRVAFDSFNSFGAKIGARFRFMAKEPAVAAAPAPTPEPTPAPAPQMQPEPAPAPAPIRGLW